MDKALIWLALFLVFGFGIVVGHHTMKQHFIQKCVVYGKVDIGDENKRFLCVVKGKTP